MLSNRDSDGVEGSVYCSSVATQACQPRKNRALTAVVVLIWLVVAYGLNLWFSRSAPKSEYVAVSVQAFAATDFAGFENRLAQALLTNDGALASPEMEKALRYGVALAEKLDPNVFPIAMVQWLEASFPEAGKDLSALMECLYYYTSAERAWLDKQSAAGANPMSLDTADLQNQYFGAALAQALFARYRALFESLPPSSSGSHRADISPMPPTHQISCNALANLSSR